MPRSLDFLPFFWLQARKKTLDLEWVGWEVVTEVWAYRWTTCVTWCSFCFSPGLYPKGKRDGIRAQLRGPLACLSLVDTRLALHRGRLFSRAMSKIGRSLCLLFDEIYFLLSPLPWAFSVKARPLTSMKHTSGMDLWFSIHNTVRASGGKRGHVVIVGTRVWPGLPQTSLPVCS